MVGPAGHVEGGRRAAGCSVTAGGDPEDVFGAAVEMFKQAAGNVVAGGPAQHEGAGEGRGDPVVDGRRPPVDQPERADDRPVEVAAGDRVFLGLGVGLDVAQQGGREDVVDDRPGVDPRPLPVTSSRRTPAWCIAATRTMVPDESVSSGCSRGHPERADDGVLLLDRAAHGLGVGDVPNQRPDGGAGLDGSTATGQGGDLVACRVEPRHEAAPDPAGRASTRTRISPGPR